MCWSIVVKEAPIACWPQLHSLVPHSITYVTEDVPMVLFSDWLTLWCVLVVCNENPTRVLNTTLPKCCLLSTYTIDRRVKFTHAYEGWSSPHASAVYWNSSGFRKIKGMILLQQGSTGYGNEGELEGRHIFTILWCWGEGNSSHLLGNSDSPQ